MMSLRTTKEQLTFVCFMSVTGGRSFVRRSCRRTLHFHFGRAIYNDTDSETEKGEKIAAYAGLSATHPLIKEIGELRRGIGPRSVRAKQKLEN